MGRIDLVENRLVGMKSHGVYETPGGTILYDAHVALEELCLDKQTMQYKQQLSLKYAELVYNGSWFTLRCAALDAFVQSTQENLTGSARPAVQRQRPPGWPALPYSLYREDYATLVRKTSATRRMLRVLSRSSDCR